MDFDLIIPDIIEHAELTNPHESCGLVIIFKGKLKYIRCNNLLSGDAFCLNPLDYARAEELGDIVAIAHSHHNISADPSPADEVACNKSNIPWIIVALPSKTYTINYPKEYNIPLIGRPFYYGTLDCYSLIRDYYKQELNISLNDYLREPNWWDLGKDLYMDNFEKEGFSIVSDLKKHDAILIQNGSNIINHVAVYLGDNFILQHCENRLSSRDVYGGYWRKNTRYILRHRSLL